MDQEKTKQAVESVADAEGVKPVVKTLEAADSHMAEGFFDRRTGAL